MLEVDRTAEHEKRLRRPREDAGTAEVLGHSAGFAGEDLVVDDDPDEQQREAHEEDVLDLALVVAMVMASRMNATMMPAILKVRGDSPLQPHAAEGTSAVST